MKKWIFIGLGFVAVAVISYFVLFNKGASNEAPSPFRAMPAQVGVLAEFESFGQIQTSVEASNYGYLIKGTDVWFELERDLGFLDTLLVNGAGIGSPEKVLCGWFPRNDGVKTLYILSYPDQKRADLEASINGQSHPKFDVTSSKLINRDLLQVAVSGQNLSFEVFGIDGALVIAHDVKLLELSLNAIEQTGSVEQIDGFKMIQEKQANYSDLKLYLHYSNLPGLLDKVFSKKFEGVSAYWSKLASISGFRVTFDSDVIGFNGFSYTGDSSIYHLSQLVAAEPGIIDMPRLLPNETVLFSSLGSSNSGAYFDKIVHKPAADWKGFFQSWVAEEWAYFRWNDGLNYRDGLIIETTDSERALEDLLGLKNFEGMDHQSFYDTALGMPYSQLYSNEILPAIFPSPVYDLGSPWYTVINNYLVFAATPSLLREMVLSQRLNQTLGKHPNYQMVTQQMASSSNTFSYILNSGLEGNLIEWLRIPAMGGIESQIAKWQSFTPITVQNTKLGKLVFSNAQVHFNPDGFLTEFAPLPNSSDSLLIAVPDSMKDTIHMVDQLPDEYFRVSSVKSHASDAGYLFGEDQDHMIYLITITGDTLKKRQIDGTIMGQIQTVDYYLNGKIQYLFNTASTMYLVDRNFEDVAAYPINLPVKASNGVKMVYYADAKKHRFFFGGTDGNFYGYTKEGSELSGWFPKTGTGIVKLQMQYFTAGNKDYLLVVSNTGVVQAFARDGSNRFDPVETGATFNQPFKVETSGSGFNLTNTAGGKTISIDKDGNLSVN